MLVEGGGGRRLGLHRRGSDRWGWGLVLDYHDGREEEVWDVLVSPNCGRGGFQPFCSSVFGHSEQVTETEHTTECEISIVEVVEVVYVV